MGSDDLIGATVAVYPLQEKPDTVIRRSIEAIESTDVEVSVGPMTTMITGTADEVFRALHLA
ncbi:MAG: hypothetical protein GY925_26900 [Actinomycetia bacterium]|nr:hypothetical protein [Actinomycetes bacterium]